MFTTATRSALLTAFVLILFPALVSAQAAKREAPPPGYTEAIRDAVTELDAGNFAEAREEFRRAHAMNPNARTLRGLGLVEFELRNYGESVELLQQALDSQVKPLDDKMRAGVQRVLVRAKGYLGNVHVATEPSAATVTVDGTVMEVGPSSTLVLEVGDHVFEFHAEGRLPTKQTVSVRGGETESLRVVLRPLAVDAPVSPEPVPNTVANTESPRPTSEKRGLLTRQYAAIGAGALGVLSLGTGVYFGLRAKDKHDQSRCSGGVCADQSGRKLNEQAQTAGNAATAMLVIGAAAVGAGAFLYFWPRPVAERRTARVRLWPAASRGFAGATGTVNW